MTGRSRVTARLAWRLVRRAPGRSVLIAALVAVPVLAGTFALVTISTARLSAGEAANRYLGQAQAIAQVTEYGRLDPSVSLLGRGQSYTGETISSEGPLDHGGRSRAAVDLTSLLPPGAHVTLAASNAGTARVTAGRRTVPVTTQPVDLADPVTRGLFTVTAGHAPTAPDQVAITRALATRLQLGVGGQARVSGVGAVRVSAILRDPRALSAQEVVAPVSTFGGLAAFERHGYSDPTWLVTFPDHTAPDLHRDLATHGVIYETRSEWQHPPRLLLSSSPVDVQVVAVIGSIIAFGIAEIVLLAGTAFAVGVRRQVRELGLLRATGGDDRDVRRVVLAQGFLLGVIGAAVGVVAGVLAVFFSRPLLEHVVDTAFGRLDVPTLGILAVAAVGVVAGLIAAVIPARTSARMPLLDMLRTRFPVDSGSVRNPRWAWAALVVGPLIVVGAAIGWHHSHDVGGSASVSLSVGGVASAITSGPHDARWTLLISFGAAVTLAGLARSCSWLVAGLGRAAHRLPLSLRLATRDAARHRHRTAPAAAAVATVVAGAVLVLFVVSSSDLRDRRAYMPYTPVGSVLVSSSGHRLPAEAVQAARQLIPARAAGTVAPIGPPSHRGPFAQIAAHAPGCTDSAEQNCQTGHIAIADPASIDIIAGRRVPAARAALVAGGAVVLRPELASHGTIGIDEVTGRHAPHVSTSTLRAAVVPGVPFYAGIGDVLVSATTARAHGWSPLTTDLLLLPKRLPTSAQQDALDNRLGPTGFVHVERGFQRHVGLVLLALVGAAALAALAGTSIAVALAMAESRADMATLAAVGASPSRRRVHAMAQAAAVGVLGSVLGLGLGVLVGLALVQGSTSYPFTFPWTWLALTVVVTPLLAVVVAAAATRSRMPLARRLA